VVGLSVSNHRLITAALVSVLGTNDGFSKGQTPSQD